jgi:hypothetical protein
MRWYDAEEKYLKMLHDICVELSKEYMTLYTKTHHFQTKLRLPSIVLSSCSGVASFGSAGFNTTVQRYISIGVGVVNVGIAIIQTYESYLKIGDIVSKSLSCSQAFKKLADDIYCEIFIPLEDRNANGITFLRDCFSRYQAILDQAPPMEFHGTPGHGGKKTSPTYQKAKEFTDRLSTDLKNSQDGLRHSVADKMGSMIVSDSKPVANDSVYVSVKTMTREERMREAASDAQQKDQNRY